MSFVLEAVRDKPIGLWLCDGTSPFTDYSGYGRTATLTTLTNAVGLVNGAAKSVVVTGTNQASFTAPVFKQGKEAQPFSIEAWVEPIEKTPVVAGEVQILGNNAKMDGLTLNGTVVSFVTKYLTTGECRASYDLQVLRSVQAVGVHLLDRNQLYINGILVAEASITEVQRVDSFVVTDNFLYSGATAGSRQLMINGIGVYSNSLSSGSILRHYNLGRMPKNEVIRLYDGDVIATSNENANILFENTWATEFDWKAASLAHTVVENDRLVPEVRNGVSVKGSWRDSIDLYDASNPGTLQAVTMNWDGVGAIVNASIDGTTWVTVTRSTNLSIIPPGFNPLGKELYIEVAFPGNIIGDTSFMDNLTVVGIKSAISQVNDGVTMTFAGSSNRMRGANPIELRDDWGVDFTGTGGSATISPDGTADPLQPKTIEVWVKVNNTTRPFKIIDGRATGATTRPYLGSSVTAGAISFANATVYKNAVLAVNDSTTLPVGEYTIFHIVATNPEGFDKPVLVNKDYTQLTNEFSGNIEIGQVIFYKSALTASQISDIVVSYSGKPASRTIDSSAMTVAENASTVNIYAHDWSLSASDG